MNPTPQILVGCHEKVVCIRVRGKGSFQNSPGIKQFASEMINRGHREFVVDLEDCPVMDSTFMGTLTGVALKLRGLGHGHLHVVHPNERNADLLRNLGLDQIIEMADEDGAPGDFEGAGEPGEELEHAAADRRQTSETMLAAHQALVDADPQNLSKFKDVLDYLKQDLARARGNGAGSSAD